MQRTSQCGNMREKACAALAEGPVATPWHSADHALLETTLSRSSFSRIAEVATLQQALRAHHTGCRRESSLLLQGCVQGSGFFCCCLDRFCSGPSSPHAGEGARSEWQELLLWVASCLQQSPAQVAFTVLQTGPSQLQRHEVGVLSGHAALAWCTCFGLLPPMTWCFANLRDSCY